MATKKETGKKKDFTKIRIVVKSFDVKLLDGTVKKIVSIVTDTGVQVVGPVPLPTKIEKITVNRSTFVNKDSREQFEIRRHKRIVDIINPTSATMASLQELNIPCGVGIEVKA